MGSYFSSLKLKLFSFYHKRNIALLFGLVVTSFGVWYLIKKAKAQKGITQNGIERKRYDIKKKIGVLYKDNPNILKLNF
jgi:hypothetical protein